MVATGEESALREYYSEMPGGLMVRGNFAVPWRILTVRAFREGALL